MYVHYTGRDYGRNSTISRGKTIIGRVIITCYFYDYEFLRNGTLVFTYREKYYLHTYLPTYLL